MGVAYRELKAAKTQAEKKQVTQLTGCKGISVLCTLPLFDRFMSTPPDPMHLIKDIIEHCVNLLSGKEESIKVRAHEKSIGRFQSSWVLDDQGLTPAPFTLAAEEQQLANERACQVLVPTGFDWRPREIFVASPQMKSHEWKQVACTGVLTFCLRGLLGSRQRSTLFKLLHIFRQVCAECVVLSSIDCLENENNSVLAFVERDFPVSLQVIVFHLLHHLPTYIRRFGPVHSF